MTPKGSTHPQYRGLPLGVALNREILQNVPLRPSHPFHVSPARTDKENTQRGGGAGPRRRPGMFPLRPPPPTSPPSSSVPRPPRSPFLPISRRSSYHVAVASPIPGRCSSLDAPTTFSLPCPARRQHPLHSLPPGSCLLVLASSLDASASLVWLDERPLHGTLWTLNLSCRWWSYIHQNITSTAAPWHSLAFVLKYLWLSHWTRDSCIFRFMCMDEFDVSYVWSDSSYVYG